MAASGAARSAVGRLRAVSTAGSLAILSALAVAGCGGRMHSSEPIVLPGSKGTVEPAPTRAPAWSTMTLSWGKLREIEHWLDAAPYRRGYWVTEGRLQLAEGQLSFATERLQPGTSAEVVLYRKQSARDGFDAVLADEKATPDQQRRAQRGMGRVASLPAVSAVPKEAGAPSIAPTSGLVRRSVWSARTPNRSKMRRASARWRWITVHHSVFSAENGSLAASLDTVQRIQRQHIEVEKYADIGYHFLIDRQGRVIEGRELIWQGAHAGGTNNVGNVGICLLGNFDVDQPSRAALASLDRLVLELQRKLSIPRTNVRPHRAWKETACPGRHLMPWFARQ